MIPSAKVSVVGLARNHETLQPENYFERFVGQLERAHRDHHRPDARDRRLDDRDRQLLKSRGCTDIRALVLVAAPEGIAALERRIPTCAAGPRRSTAT